VIQRLAETPLDVAVRPIRRPIGVDWCVFVAVLCQICKAKARILFLIVGTDEAISITSPIPVASDTKPVGLHTSSRLHTSPRLYAGDEISGDAILYMTIQHFVTIWVSSRQVQ